MFRTMIAGLALLPLAAQAQTPGHYGYKSALPSQQLNTDLAGKADTANGILTNPTISNGISTTPFSFLNPVPAQDTRFAAGGLSNGNIIGAGGNTISYCPTLSCVRSPSADHQRTSALFWSTTADDGHSEEQTVAIETTVATGYQRAWAPSTAYALGDNVAFGGTRNAVYRAVQAGTSASSGDGPTGKGSSITDGSVTWAWINDSAINAKVGLYNEESVVAGAGASWAQANNVNLQRGMIPSFNINTEFDFTNDAADCAIGVANCNNLEVASGGAYTSTQAIHVSSGNAGPKPATLWALRLNGSFLAQEADIEVDSSAKVGLAFNFTNFGPSSHSVATIVDNTTSPVSYDDVGPSHTIASYRIAGGSYGRAGIIDQSNSPISYLIDVGKSHATAGFEDDSNSAVAFKATGTHSVASFQDASTTPASLSLGGTHSIAALVDASVSLNGIALNGTYSGAQIVGAGFFVQPNGQLHFTTSAALAGTPATYACFTSAGQLVSSATPCSGS